MAVGAAIGGAKLVGGAILGSSAVGAWSSRKQAKEQRKAAEKNIAWQQDVFAQQREDAKPWRDAGVNALEQLQTGIQNGSFDPARFTTTAKNPNALSFTGEDPEALQFTGKDPGEFEFTFDESSPAYQFIKAEGVSALDKSAAARGKLLSGDQQKAVTEFSQNLASQEYQNQFNRSLTQHQTKVNAFNRGRQDQIAEHQSKVNAFNRGRQDQLAEHNSSVNAFNRQYQMDLDKYRFNEAGKGQRFNMLSSLARTGQISNQATAAARDAMAGRVGNSLLNIGQANANQYAGYAQAANQGIQNYLTYDTAGLGGKG